MMIVCLRCSDRSEFGTGFGGVQCNDCDGILTMITDDEWRCAECGQERGAEQCQDLLTNLNNELSLLSHQADQSRQSVLEFQNVRFYYFSLKLVPNLD